MSEGPYYRYFLISVPWYDGGPIIHRVIDISNPDRLLSIVAESWSQEEAEALYDRVLRGEKVEYEQPGPYDRFRREEIL
jgi:hypothetical protein